MNAYMELLGLKCRDRVTGFKGIVSSVSFDLYGCVQVSLTPEVDKEGKAGDGYWYDHKRIDVLDKTPVMARPIYETKRPGQEIGAAEKPRPPR